jgi:hypothetical protein
MKTYVWLPPEDRKDLKNKKFKSKASFGAGKKRDYRLDLVECTAIEPRTISFESWQAAKRAGWKRVVEK